MSVSESVVRNWLDGFGRVWRERDADGAAALFTEDGSYRNSPFLPDAFVGHEAIAGFWAQAVAPVTDVVFRYGAPVIDGDRVAVEWWTNDKANGVEQTLAGLFLLTFSGDRVSDLREAYMKQEGMIHPHVGWGE